MAVCPYFPVLSKGSPLASCASSLTVCHNAICWPDCCFQVKRLGGGSVPAPKQQISWTSANLLTSSCMTRLWTPCSTHWPGKLDKCSHGEGLWWMNIHWAFCLDSNLFTINCFSALLACRATRWRRVSSSGCRKHVMDQFCPQQG